MDQEIKAAVEKFCAGNEDTAFFELVEMPGNILPGLIDCFHTEELAAVRAFLVKAAWERRHPSVIQFLGEALDDLNEEVWQEALDGLVTLASDESLAVLQSARSREFSDEAAYKRFHLWLEEAIEQVLFELKRA
jgi:HEAT repeat protein